MLFEIAVRKSWSRLHCALSHCTLHCFAPCMDMHGSTLVYYNSRSSPAGLGALDALRFFCTCCTCENIAIYCTGATLACENTAIYRTGATLACENTAIYRTGATLACENTAIYCTGATLACEMAA